MTWVKWPKSRLINPENLVIESKYTWQRFYAENPLAMAAKRKQLEMIQVLLPYYDRIENQDAASKAKSGSLSLDAV